MFSSVQDGTAPDPGADPRVEEPSFDQGWDGSELALAAQALGQWQRQRQLGYQYATPSLSPRRGFPYYQEPPVLDHEDGLSASGQTPGPYYLPHTHLDPELLPFSQPTQQYETPLPAPSENPLHLSQTISNPPADTPMPDATQGATQPRRKALHQSARSRRENERLQAASGKVTPSRLAPGEKPVRIGREVEDDSSFPIRCPICDSRFHRKDHVKSHFPKCAEKYGNPMGSRWDDGVPGNFRARARVTKRSAEDGGGQVERAEWPDSARTSRNHRSRSLSPWGIFD